MNQQNFADISTMASATRGLRRVFIRDLVLPARIGIHDHEREQAQPVIINVDASVEEDRWGSWRGHNGHYRRCGVLRNPDRTD